MKNSLCRLGRGIAFFVFLALALAGRTAATVIGFEEFGNVGLYGPTITDQYAGVVFSSVGTEENHVTSQAGIGSGLDFLCTGMFFSLDCSGETILTFANPVSGLSFLAVGDNVAGVQAKVDVFQNGVFSATKAIVLSGNFNVPDRVDLSTWNSITAIRIYAITDPGGLGWDDFTYAASAVPEPQSLSLMLAGLSVMTWTIHRHRK